MVECRDRSPPGEDGRNDRSEPGGLFVYLGLGLEVPFRGLSKRGKEDFNMTVQELRDRAAADMAQWPQYKGYFDRHQLCTVKRDVRTKLGKAFFKGEVTIFNPERTFTDEPDYVSVYSFSNKCCTMIKRKSIQEV